MPVIDVNESDNHYCPFRDWNPCFGERCMAWSWAGPAYDHAETNNLQDTEEGPRPIGTPPLPDDQGGWEMDGPPYNHGYHRSGKDKLPPAKAQRWRRPRANRFGFCSRCGPDRDGYPF